jgi:autonomous glycyl radical cofactor GrcA
VQRHAPACSDVHAVGYKYERCRRLPFACGCNCVDVHTYKHVHVNILARRELVDLVRFPDADPDIDYRYSCVDCNCACLSNITSNVMIIINVHVGQR